MFSYEMKTKKNKASSRDSCSRRCQCFFHHRLFTVSQGNQGRDGVKNNKKKKKHSPQGRGGNKHINNRPHSHHYLIRIIITYVFFFFTTSSTQYHLPNIIIIKSLRCAEQASYTYEVRKVKLATSTALFTCMLHIQRQLWRGKRWGKGQKESSCLSVCRKKEPPEAYIFTFFFFSPILSNTSSLIRFQSPRGRYSGHNIPAILLPKSAISFPNQSQSRHLADAEEALQDGGPGTTAACPEWHPRNATGGIVEPPLPPVLAISRQASRHSAPSRHRHALRA